MASIADIEKECESLKRKRLEELVASRVAQELEAERKKRDVEIENHKRQLATLKSEISLLQLQKAVEEKGLSELKKMPSEKLVDKVRQLEAQLQFYMDLDNVYPCYGYSCRQITHLVRAHTRKEADAYIQRADREACISDNYCKRVDLTVEDDDQDEE